MDDRSKTIKIWDKFARMWCELIMIWTNDIYNTNESDIG